MVVSVGNVLSETFWGKFLFTFKRGQNKIFLKGVWFTVWQQKNPGHLKSPVTVSHQNSTVFSKQPEVVSAESDTPFALDPAIALVHIPFHW